jgi:membrane protein implicated in regulation of membrane protease activity
MFDNFKLYLIDLLHLNTIGAHWFWWMLALIMLCADLMLRTVYLFMMGLGLFAGGLAALLGLDLLEQQLIAAAVAVLGCLIMQRIRARAPKALNSQRNTNVQNDVGNTVMVNEWRAQNADYVATVQYRASQWSAKMDTLHASIANLSATPQPGFYQIVGIEGTTLLLKAS